MENQHTNESEAEKIAASNAKVQHPQSDPAQQLTNQDANEDQTSLASDGPVSKNEGNGTSPDLNDPAKVTNADEPDYGGDTAKSLDRDQEEIDLDLNDGDLDTDVPTEKK